MDNNHNNEVLKALIKFAGHEILEEKGNEMPCEEDIKSIDIDFSKVDKTIQRLISIEKKKGRAKKAKKTILRSVAIFLAIIIISTIAIMSSEALRVKFLNLFYNSDETSIQINITEDDNMSELSNRFIEPTYLPNGYMFEDVVQVGTLTVITYVNDVNGDIIRIEQNQDDGEITVDNEGVGSYETKIGDYKALVILGKESNKVICIASSWYFEVEGNLEADELIKISESLIK